MFDVKWIRDNPEGFDAALEKRGLSAQATLVLELDKRRRAAQTRLQELQARRKEASREIGAARGKGTDASVLVADATRLKDDLAAAEEAERETGRQLDEVLAGIPNLPADDVPVGADDGANRELRRHGQPQRFDFAPREHYDIGEALGQMDFARAAKLSGARFVVLTGALARLERALAQFMLDLHVREFGYVETSPPMLVRDRTAYGTGQLPRFRADLFQAVNMAAVQDAVARRMEALDAEFESIPKAINALKNAYRAEVESGQHSLWLIPTAEVPLTNLVADEILEEKALPLRFTAHTGCFRAEAGAAGKDTRGMLRQHQFYKVELVSIAHPDRSDEELERMTACAEEVLRRLGLHYRVVVLSTGDMGFAARKTYDLEVWLPGQGRFREISSCSNCGEFQARRMGARFRPAGGKGTRFVHTLNGSGVAVGRALIAVLESYQQADGSVAVPEALRPYMDGRAVIRANA